MLKFQFNDKIKEYLKNISNMFTKAHGDKIILSISELYGVLMDKNVDIGDINSIVTVITTTYDEHPELSIKSLRLVITNKSSSKLSVSSMFAILKIYDECLCDIVYENLGKTIGKISEKEKMTIYINREVIFTSMVKAVDGTFNKNEKLITNIMKTIAYFYNTKKQLLISYNYLYATELLIKKQINNVLLPSYMDNFNSLIESDKDWSSVFHNPNELLVFNTFLKNKKLMSHYVLILQSVLEKEDVKASKLAASGSIEVLLKELCEKEMNDDERILYLKMFLSLMKDPFIRSLLTRRSPQYIVGCTKLLENKNKNIVRYSLNMFKSYLSDNESVQLLLVRPKTFSTIINYTTSNEKTIKELALSIQKKLIKPQLNNPIGLLKNLKVDSLFYLLRNDSMTLLPNIMMALLFNLRNIACPLSNRIPNALKKGFLLRRSSNQVLKSEWKPRYCIIVDCYLYEYKFYIPQQKTNVIENIIKKIGNIFKIYEGNEYEDKDDIFNECKLKFKHIYNIANSNLTSEVSENGEKMFLLEEKTENYLEDNLSLQIKGYSDESTKRWGRVLQGISIKYNIIIETPNFKVDIENYCDEFNPKNDNYSYIPLCSTTFLPCIQNPLQKEIKGYSYNCDQV